MLTLEEIFSDVSSVIKEVLASSAVAPQAKSDLTATLNGAVDKAKTLGATLVAGASTLVADAPAEAGALTGAAVTAVGARTGALAPVVDDVIEPIAVTTVQDMAANMLAVFQAHNQSLMTELGKIASAAGATTKPAAVIAE